MRFTPIIFSKLLAAINRRQFNAIVTRHAGDAYDKGFRSWDHLVAMTFAQFSTAISLRGLIQEKLGAKDLAIADWRRAAALDPAFQQPADALRRLGIMR